MTAPLIYTALAAVMADVDHVAKRDRNEHQEFLFRGIDAVVNAVGPILRKHAVIVVPDVVSVDYDTVATSTGKPATACRVLARYVFWATDGSSVTTTVAAEAWDAGDKAAPKAMSVAFRTALLQALALPTDEPDPDSQTFERDNMPRPVRGRPAATPDVPHDDAPGDPELRTEAQSRRLFALLHENGLEDRVAVLTWLTELLGRPVGSTKTLTKREASKAMDALAPEPPVEDQP